MAGKDAEKEEVPEEAPKRAPPGTRYALVQADAVSWLRTLPDASVDLVVTDPPYESLEKHRAVGTTTRLSHSKGSSNDWFTVFPNARFPELFAEVHRVLKKNAHFYLYCDQETAFVAKPAGEAAGFKFWKPLVWDKCLHPDTRVWTGRGVVPIGEVRAGDLVRTPAGRLVGVLATRRTRARTTRLGLSDGTAVIASSEHRFVREGGAQVEAQELTAGSTLSVAHGGLGPVGGELFSNDQAGGFRVPCDPQHRAEALTVTSVEPGPEEELVDIAIDDDEQLFVLANGLVTHNCAIGMGYHYRSRYELILFFEKGKRKLADLGVADLIREKRIHRGYPTEKPVAVSRVLIEQSTLPGELVIDPFMGTASAGVAAVLGGRSFLGADISDKAIAIAEERLAATGAEKSEVTTATSAQSPGQLALDIGKRD